MIKLDSMPRKTLALISGLVIVTIILFVIALRAGQQQAPVAQKTSMVQPTPAVPAHTVLMVTADSTPIAPGQQGSVTINMNTSDNAVTAVQLELGYDPALITNVKVTPGPLFSNPGLSYGKDNPTTGRYTYMLGISPGGQPVKGTGVIATVTFSTTYAAVGKSTQIGLLPTSLVTARGVAQSVLKDSTGAVITVSGTSAAAPAVKDTAGMGAKTGTTSSTTNSTALPK